MQGKYVDELFVRHKFASSISKQPGRFVTKELSTELNGRTIM